MQLHRAGVLDGAIALLDASGLDALTMRKLASRLGVQAGALYWHFKDKAALLDAMAERLVEGVVADPLPDGPWDEQMTILAQRVHQALLAHRDGARVVAGTYVPDSSHRRMGILAFGIFHEAGLSQERAIWTTFTLLYYILGHTIEEQAQAELVAQGEWKAKEALYLAATEGDGIMALARTFDADPAERFAWGLRLFLDGVRAQLPH
jgi:TetR/AcrR family tetracycline transcriptional repressor